MIANFFNKTKPVIVVNLLILFTVFYIISTFLTQFVEFSLAVISSKFALLVGFIFMFLVINFILKKNSLTNDNSFTLLILILFLVTFYETLNSEKFFFSNLFLLFAFRKVYSLNSGFYTNLKLFDAAFWIGISSLFYFWSILFIPLIYLAMFIYRKVNVKKLFIPIIGCAAPIFVFFTYYFYFDKMEVFYSAFNFNYNLNFGSYNALNLLIPITLLITLLIWCVVFLAPKVALMSNQFKLGWQVLIAHLLISIAVVILSPIKNGSEIWFMLLPSSIIITNFLQKTGSETFKNVILYLLLSVSVLVYFL
ncbi:hypothetical protein [Lutibacter citreus]|uniref:hypothetical protein n=1 Tax=Lutibacter citreus TaxID=2138210 RepID=UPI000DBE5FFF|nr:hypothetical protein [Lutibacter citreus]